MEAPSDGGRLPRPSAPPCFSVRSWIGDMGGALGRQRLIGAAGQHAVDRWGFVRADPGLRSISGPTSIQWDLAGPRGKACAGGRVLRGGAFFGAVLGVAAANVMFGEPVFSASDHARSGSRMILTRASPLRPPLGDHGVQRRRSNMIVCGGRLHHVCILVHGLDLVRQPGVTVARP